MRFSRSSGNEDSPVRRQNTWKSSCMTLSMNRMEGMRKRFAFMLIKWRNRPSLNVLPQGVTHFKATHISIFHLFLLLYLRIPDPGLPCTIFGFSAILWCEAEAEMALGTRLRDFCQRAFDPCPLRIKRPPGEITFLFCNPSYNWFKGVAFVLEHKMNRTPIITTKALVLRIIPEKRTTWSEDDGYLRSVFARWRSFGYWRKAPVQYLYWE